jgi:predicted nucleic acid-binding protein
MVVVDTNVLVRLLIEGERTADAQALRRADADWRSEPLVLVEFSNLQATQVRLKALSAADAAGLLAAAARTIGVWAEVPHTEALTTAVRHGISAYDARFVACAERLGRKLITEDGKLRTAAPGATQSLAEALGG